MVYMPGWGATPGGATPAAPPEVDSVEDRRLSSCGDWLEKDSSSPVSSDSVAGAEPWVRVRVGVRGRVAWGQGQG